MEIKQCNRNPVFLCDFAFDGVFSDGNKFSLRIPERDVVEFAKALLDAYEKDKNGEVVVLPPVVKFGENGEPEYIDGKVIRKEVFADADKRMETDRNLSEEMKQYIVFCAPIFAQAKDDIDQHLDGRLNKRYSKDLPLLMVYQGEQWACGVTTRLFAAALATTVYHTSEDENVFFFNCENNMFYFKKIAVSFSSLCQPADSNGNYLSVNDIRHRIATRLKIRNCFSNSFGEQTLHVLKSLPAEKFFHMRAVFIDNLDPVLLNEVYDWFNATNQVRKENGIKPLIMAVATYCRNPSNPHDLPLPQSFSCKPHEYILVEKPKPSPTREEFEKKSDASEQNTAD